MGNTMVKTSKKEISAYSEVADVFMRLEVQLNHCWLGRTDKQVELIMADENIETLKFIENFVLDIEFEKVPDLSQYENYVKNKNTSALQNLQRYFNRLRFNRDNPPSDLVLNEGARIFLNECHSIEAAAQNQGKSTKSRPLLGMFKRQLLDNIPVNIEQQSSRLLALIENIRTKIDSSSVQAKKRADRVTVNKRFSDTVQYLDDCFKACPQLFVICMDLGYPSQGRQSGPITAMTNNPNQIQSNWADLAIHLRTEMDIIGHFEKLEFTQQRGYSLHVTFLCFPRKDFTEVDWAIRIGQMWISITQGKGAYHNSNSEIRRFSDHAVGLIKATEKTKRDEMLRWVVRYSTLSSLYISVPYHPTQVYQIGKQPKRDVPLVSQAMSNNRNTKQEASAFRLSSNEILDAWKIPRGNLSQQSIEQIKELPIIYNQIAALIQSNQFLPNNSVSLKSVQIELLVQIEIFIAYTSDSNSLAFNTGSNWGEQPTDKDAMQWRTRLGKQLIDLYSHCNFEYVTTKLLPNIEYLSPSVKIYCAVVYSQNVWKEDSQIIAEMSTRSLMRFYNGFIEQIRLLLQNDHEVLKKLNELKSAAHRSIDDLKVHNNYGKKIESIPADPAHIDVGDIPHSKRTKSLQAFISEQFKTTNKSFIDAKLYVSELFKKDVILISLKFHITCGTHDIPQQTFAPLLTMFMRYGKNCKPLAWSLGYVGRWEHVAPMQRCAHVIFFMHADLAASVENITQQIKDYWVKIIHEKADQVVIPTDQDSFTLVVSAVESPISHLHDSFNEYFCQIDSSDKDKQKIFKQQILLYFAKSTLYYQPNQSKLPKALIKGHLSTAKYSFKIKWRNPQSVRTTTSSEQNYISEPSCLSKPNVDSIVNDVEQKEVVETTYDTKFENDQTAPSEFESSVTPQTSLSDKPESSATDTVPKIYKHPYRSVATLAKEYQNNFRKKRNINSKK